MKIIIVLHGLLIVLICSMSIRCSKAASDGDEYDDEYNYDDDYEYDENSPTPKSGGEDYEATSASSEILPPKLGTDVHKVTEVDISPKLDGNEEDKTESLMGVLIAETEIIQDEKCPKLCTCDEQLQFIDCSNQSLSGIPKNLPNTSLQVNLSNNDIDAMQESDLVNLTVVRKIILRNNKIQNINPNIFQSLHRLGELDLSSNKISKIDPDTFIHAPGLAVLTLNDNPIAFEPNQAFLNLPELDILNLVGCNITELYNETFRNLTGLSSLNLANNSFVDEINVDAFHPLDALLKLKIPHVSKDATYGLCQKIPVIDVISFDNYNISCYELISGSTYDESRITHAPPTVAYVETTTVRVRTTSTTQMAIEEVTEDTKSPRVNVTKTEEISPRADEPTTKNDALNTTSSEDVKSEEVDQSAQSIKTLLIASIAVAVLGLAIGLICRKDVFGVKTKLCRTQRPEPPTIPEQVPLNKV